MDEKEKFLRWKMAQMDWSITREMRMDEKEKLKSFEKWKTDQDEKLKTYQEILKEGCDDRREARSWGCPGCEPRCPCCGRPYTSYPRYWYR